MSPHLILIALSLLSSAPHAPARAPVPRGEYLGQPPPGATPQLFAPDVVSTDLGERDIAFTPDGREIYWTLQGGTFAKWCSVVVFVRREKDRWTEPRVASFSGRYNDVEPFISPDGKRLYFVSNRPPEGTGPARADYDIWFVERTAAGWGEARNAGAPVNTEKNEFYPAVTRDGTLYFTATREGGRGGDDIWRSALSDGGFAPPENLGDSVNTDAGEYNAFVAPDGSTLILGRHGDLLVSFRRGDGSWTGARAMGPTIDTPGLDYCPSVSPDGRYLFFTSSRPPERDYARTPPGYEALAAQVTDPERRRMLRVRMFPYHDIYWVRSDIIETLRKEALGGAK